MSAAVTTRILPLKPAVAAPGQTALYVILGNT